jgi:hypothetical protein
MCRSDYGVLPKSEMKSFFTAKNPKSKRKIDRVREDSKLISEPHIEFLWRSWRLGGSNSSLLADFLKE